MKKGVITLILITILLPIQYVIADPTVDVPYTSQTVVVNGILDISNEYSEALSYSFGTRDGFVTVYFQYDTDNLYLGIDVDGDISWGEQIWLGFDLNNDDVLNIDDDLWILWHGHPHGDPDNSGGPWIYIWTGEVVSETNIPEISHDTQTRIGGYQTEFSISMSFFTSNISGFHIRQSPDNNISYIWKIPDGTDVQGQIDDKDASVYGDIVFESHTISVDIDVKPHSISNPINLKSKGKVPVAILTTESYDASDTDPGSVMFAEASPLKWVFKDIDGDGDVDLLLHFKTQELQISEFNTFGVLTGLTLDGTSIEGMDNILTKF